MRDENVVSIKLSLEKYYENLIQHAIERENRMNEFEASFKSPCISKTQKNEMMREFQLREENYLKLKRTKLSISSFNIVQIIGKGAFGEVRLVQKIDNGKVYAMKVIEKSSLMRFDQLAHIKAERDLLVESKSIWVVDLYYSFQDRKNLYLVMDFLPGGDMMNLLIRLNIIPENMAVFYIAECVLAIDSVHQLGFIHRDIKPDNMLFDVDGHLKLTDFGLSTGFHSTHGAPYYKRLFESMSTPATISNSSQFHNINLTLTREERIQGWRKNRKQLAYSVVGTPVYIAPEVFSQDGYGKECDWWSLGMILFEMLVGYPPFCSDVYAEVYHKIVNWKTTFKIPDDCCISPEAEDLIKKLICDANCRLGKNGVHEIKSHPFFRGIDWHNIRGYRPPFVPQLNSVADTRYFSVDEDLTDLDKRFEKEAKITNTTMHSDLAFIGYTFNRFQDLSDKNII